MDKILIIGASGHAKVIIETVELNRNYQIYGLIDSFKTKGSKVFGHEIIGDENCILDLFDKGVNKGIIAIGDNWDRYLMYKKIIELVPDFEFISVIHPSSVISPSVTIGAGTVILASVTVNADARINNFCILNTGCNFGHDSSLSDFSSLAPGVSVGGNVNIGKCTAIFLGANIIQNINIGMHSAIGAGSLIIDNVEDFKLYYGVPGKEIRVIKKGEIFLRKR
ncbi:acetyltransferase [uncultured Aquimarina sp.]|uniref:acetyltransferase n=1 Tax=uncultured Aquimarina sp. TaxID=575652 RepID=UPI0026027F53|nr:acetyltransferase [uncultured Aquimarina sp.]